MPARSPKGSSPERALLLLAVIAALVVALGAIRMWPVLAVRAEGLFLALLDQIDKPADPQGKPKVFVVQAGESAAIIGERLEKEGLITKALGFRLLASAYRVDTHLAAGEYELSSGMSMTEILSRLRGGLVRSLWITIPEGWRASEVAAYLAQRGVFPVEDFWKAYEKGDFPYPLVAQRPPGAPLEGYLFPDTYRLPAGTGAREVLELLLRTFEERFTLKMRQQAERAGLPVHEVVTLAAIVEREAVLPAERPVIAGVYLNRLRAGMPLQADPTVQYALGSDPEAVARFGYWKRALTAEDLLIDVPYNTYRYRGLPPGPISNPGLASLQAVLEPADTPYRYFVAGKDGSHLFATTLEEHLANVRRAQAGGE